MKLIKLLFPDKIIKLQKGANMLISLFLCIPYVAAKLGDLPYNDSKDNIFKIVMKVLAGIGMLASEFIKRLAFIFIVTWIPWKQLGVLCPLISSQRELCIIYCFTILSVICGSFTNTTMFTMSENDFFLLNHAGVNASRYYFGRIIYRMAADFIFFMPSLMIVGVSTVHAVLLSLVTALARPVGEVFELVLFSYAPSVHRSKAAYDGIFIALSIIVAYACPYAFRSISTAWYLTTGPVAVIAVFVLSFVSLYILWNYKRYSSVVRELVFARRID